MTGQQGNETLVPHSESPELLVPPHLKNVPRHKLVRLLWDSSRMGTARHAPENKKPWGNKKERKALKRAKVARMKGGKA